MLAAPHSDLLAGPVIARHYGAGGAGPQPGAPINLVNGTIDALWHVDYVVREKHGHAFEPYAGPFKGPLTVAVLMFEPRRFIRGHDSNCCTLRGGNSWLTI